MSTILEIWEKDQNLLINKKISQIIQFIGEGKLRDNNQTSIELREWLDVVSIDYLEKYLYECLDEKYLESGFVLQDIINQLGKRLGYEVNYGYYRGKRNEPGYDGIWETINGNAIIIEVKTTDAYRINLDRVMEYKNSLKIRNEKYEYSSVLIVVGRDDTGDLEAQIRGSKFAWDIRLISTDALIKLVKLKEKLNDSNISKQINIALKPIEYTRVDKLIDIMFLAVKDVESDKNVNNNEEKENIEDQINIREDKTKETPVGFQEECLMRLRVSLNKSLVKLSKTSYGTQDKKFGIVIIISKEYDPPCGYEKKYWYSFHPYQSKFLEEYENKKVIFGCGNAESIISFPYNEIEKLLQYMWQTEKKDRTYKHIVILKNSNKFYLRLPYDKKNDFLDISKYLL